MHKLWQKGFLWRGSLSDRRTVPLGCEAAPKPLCAGFMASASHSNGSKLPRHKGSAEVSVHA
ncbi:hypothetical protein DOZ80_15815 [Pseudomonas fluorescens]|uniref:Uncharacterized protein n=1 Tax=Pseudomonas fluorescens TaxID=294 RepID=A0A327N278_PSEFL|nr:hypothetical protein DOZ80_15815 [Pseudomonas fluorescens]